MSRALPNPDDDPITVPPTLVNRDGRAWRCVPIANPPQRLGTVVDWLVEAPEAHPVWHSYAVCLIHLRPLPDMPPPRFYLPGATHEIWVAALDPWAVRQPMILRTQMMAYLLPLNFAAQFIASDDAVAMARVEGVVRAICFGTLSPDSDAIDVWCELFGDNMRCRPLFTPTTH